MCDVIKLLEHSNTILMIFVI